MVGWVMMDEDFRQAALDYHRLPRPGKLSVEPTKRMATQRDLALAYSPGVAAACDAIKADPDTARDYTARGNLVAVISNGTAVLGLGNIGALAGAMIGPLPAAAGFEGGKALGREKAGRSGRRAGGIERGVFQQPDHLLPCPFADRGGALLHGVHGSGIRGKAWLRAPFRPGGSDCGSN
jgi:hypothetical protein